VEQDPNDEPAEELLRRILIARQSEWEINTISKGPYTEPPLPEGVTELPKLAQDWTWATLEQLTSADRVICYGILMPKEDFQNGILYVKVKNIKNDKVDLASLSRTSPEIAKKYARASLRTGDLILAIRGTYGRVAVVPPELDGGNITQDTARLAITDLANRDYIAWYLRSEFAQTYFKKVARGVAVKGVNIADVRLCPVPLPPLAEQQRIVTEIERRLSVAAEVEVAVEVGRRRANRLRQSVLKRAFEGKLVGQGPEEEPAEGLSERGREGHPRMEHEYANDGAGQGGKQNRMNPKQLDFFSD
jgi:type I restriction enzyme S subunit